MKKRRKVKLINHDCLPISMLLYIMLAYLMLLYLMLFVCIMLLFCHLFLQMLFVFMLCLGLLTHGLFVSCLICIMHSALNLYVFPNSMFSPLFFLR